MLTSEGDMDGRPWLFISSLEPSSTFSRRFPLLKHIRKLFEAARLFLFGVTCALIRLAFSIFGEEGPDSPFNDEHEELVVECCI
jgi:hypothetical protein